MTRVGVNQTQIKTTNQSLIIHEIRKHKSLSRSELARTLKLSAPSISFNIDDLISRNVIIETGAGKSLRGRKPINLEFNNRYGYVVAVDMVSSTTKIALADLSGTNVLEYGYVENALHITADVVDRIIAEIGAMLERQNIAEDKLLCICVGSPGIIDPHTNAIIYAPRVKDLPGTALRDRLADRFRTKIMIKNDMNCFAIGEHLYGAGQGYRNFINIQLDVGTGAGIILNNKLFEGSNGSAGEIGLWAMDFKDVIHHNRIQLDNVFDHHVSLFGLLCKVKDMYPEVLSPLDGEDITPHNIANYARLMFNAAKSGDERVLRIIREGVVELGCVLRNIHLLLDLELVVIGGLMLELGDLYLEPLQRFCAEHVSERLKIVPSSLGDKAVLYGGIGEAINVVIEDIVNCRG
jgi:predicted NBD/HSP70 family sugar kinase